MHSQHYLRVHWIPGFSVCSKLYEAFHLKLSPKMSSRLFSYVFYGVVLLVLNSDFFAYFWNQEAVNNIENKMLKWIKWEWRIRTGRPNKEISTCLSLEERKEEQSPHHTRIMLEEGSLISDAWCMKMFKLLQNFLERSKFCLGEYEWERIHEFHGSRTINYESFLIII